MGKVFTQIQKEDMKGYIKQCERLRYTEKETLEHLEDKGFDISHETLYKLKRELKEELKTRFQEIGEHELAYEHMQSIDLLKELQRRMLKAYDECQEPMEKAKIASEIRSIAKDLAEFYSATDIVDNVYRFMEQTKEEQKKKDINKVGKKDKE